MPEAYDLHEGRFLIEASNASGAGGLSTALPTPTPAGKIRTVVMATYYPSVAETQTVWYSIQTASARVFPITVPVSIALSATIPYPVLTEGLEIKLWPGDYLVINRAAATAGSTMTIIVRYVESDLPLYEYVEPQVKKRMDRARSTLLMRAGGGGAGGGGGGALSPPGRRPPGGGGGSPPAI